MTIGAPTMRVTSRLRVSSRVAALAGIAILLRGWLNLIEACLAKSVPKMALKECVLKECALKDAPTV